MATSMLALNIEEKAILDAQFFYWWMERVFGATPDDLGRGGHDIFPITENQKQRYQEARGCFFRGERVNITHS